MKHLKKRVLKISMCIALLLSFIIPLNQNIYAYNEGVSISTNETSNTDAKYQATFILDSKKLNGDIKNVQLEGGFQFIKSSEDHLYLENGASNDNITWYSAYEYQDGMYPTGGCGNKNRQDLNYDGNYILYDMENKDNIYSITLPLPATEYFYAYLITYTNGSTELIQDPANPSKINPNNQHDASWSYFYVGNSEDALSGQRHIYPRIDEKSGTYKYETYTAYDNTTNNIGIYTPYGYENNNNTNYKTIYLAHGNGGNETEWFQLGSAGNIVDNLIINGELANCIIVTLNNSHFSNTGFDVASNSILVQDVVNNVIPFVEKNYKVSTDPKDRAYAGLSAGGVAASAVMEMAPDSFGYFGIISASAQIDDALFTDELVSKLQTKNIYLSAGTVDFGLINSFFQASILDYMLPKLDATNIKYTFETQNGGHDWNTWRGAFTTFAKDILWNPQNNEYYISNVNKIKQGDNIEFTTNLASSEILNIKIDNQIIDSNYYVVTNNKNTTVINLLNAYTLNLSIGNHTLTLITNNDEVSTTFTVTQKEIINNNPTNNDIKNEGSNTQFSDSQVTTKVPETGDSSSLAIYSSILLLSSIIIPIIKKKSQR